MPDSSYSNISYNLKQANFGTCYPALFNNSTLNNKGLVMQENDEIQAKLDKVKRLCHSLIKDLSKAMETAESLIELSTNTKNLELGYVGALTRNNVASALELVNVLNSKLPETKLREIKDEE